MENSVPATLRPLGLGELLDRAIRLYRANFLTFIGIIAVVYVPLMILQTAASALMSSSILNRDYSNPQNILSNPAYWIGIISSLILAFLQFILVQGFATGALARAVADNYMGKRTGILDAYRGMSGSWITLLGALLLIGLILLAVGIWWIIVPCLGWITGIGMLVFLGAVISPMVPPVVVLEKQSAINSIQRAWNLTRRRFWPLLGTILVLWIFSLIVVNGPSAIANALLVTFIGSIGDSTLQLIMTSVIQGLVSIVFVLLYYPLQMSAFTLIYFDLRVRTEGFDIALLTRETTEETDLADISTIPAPQSSERLITWPELGNFAILELVGVGLYFLFFTLIAGGVFFLASLFRLNP